MVQEEARAKAWTPRAFGLEWAGSDGETHEHGYGRRLSGVDSGSSFRCPADRGQACGPPRSPEKVAERDRSKALIVWCLSNGRGLILGKKNHPGITLDPVQFIARDEGARSGRSLAPCYRLPNGTAESPT